MFKLLARAFRIGVDAIIPLAHSHLLRSMIAIINANVFYNKRRLYVNSLIANSYKFQIRMNLYTTTYVEYIVVQMAAGVRSVQVCSIHSRVQCQILWGGVSSWHLFVFLSQMILTFFLLRVRNARDRWTALNWCLGPERSVRESLLVGPPEWFGCIPFGNQGIGRKSKHKSSHTRRDTGCEYNNVSNSTKSE